MLQVIRKNLRISVPKMSTEMKRKFGKKVSPESIRRLLGKSGQVIMADFRERNLPSAMRIAKIS